MRARQADELNSLTNKPPPSPPYALEYCIHYPSVSTSTIWRTSKAVEAARCVIIITTRKATSLFSRKRFLILITTPRFNSYKYNTLCDVYILYIIYIHMRRQIRGTTSLTNRSFLNCKKLKRFVKYVGSFVFISPILRLSYIIINLL